PSLRLLIDEVRVGSSHRPQVRRHRLLRTISDTSLPSHIAPIGKPNIGDSTTSPAGLPITKQYAPAKTTVNNPPTPHEIDLLVSPLQAHSIRAVGGGSVNRLNGPNA